MHRCTTVWNINVGEIVSTALRQTTPACVLVKAVYFEHRITECDYATSSDLDCSLKYYCFLIFFCKELLWLIAFINNLGSFFDINISHGRVAKRLRCGEIFNDCHITIFIVSMLVKKFWKASNIWQWWVKLGGPVFLTPSNYCSLHAFALCMLYSALM